MSVELSEKREGSWFGQAVYALDRRLRRRQGTFEYSDMPYCLFRLQPCRTDEALELSDGTRVQAGDRALKLHFWNEHIPRMGEFGPTVGWARLATRALDGSLRDLAHYLARHPEFADIRVLFGDMSLATARQTEQLDRLIGRYGFELPPMAPSATQDRRPLRRIGNTILVLMLMLATNPQALRRGALRHRRRRLYLSRAGLEARYGGRLGRRPPG